MVDNPTYVPHLINSLFNFIMYEKHFIHNILNIEMCPGMCCLA